MQIADFNKEAIFSDGTINYCNPIEPKRNDAVSIRLRTSRNDSPECFAIINKEKKRLLLISSDRYFNYFETTFIAKEDFYEYYFEIVFNDKTYYFGKLGLSDSYLDTRYMFHLFTDFQTPDWAKGAVFYQILVDRFNNADHTNDVRDKEYKYLDVLAYTNNDWYANPSMNAVPEFFGGDIEGVIEKLDYLSELGVAAIYLNPIFVSPSNHKYDIQDYDYVDPHFGRIAVDKEYYMDMNQPNSEALSYITRVTDKKNLEASNELFIRLVEKAHRRGIRVILDGVFNHCGSFNKWLDAERIYEDSSSYEKGAYISESSPYKSYFRFQNNDYNPYNSSYDCWWGYKTLPKLNYEDSNALYEDILRIAEKWVSPPYNADGWRLDVAADLGYTREFNHSFWKKFRETVKNANKDAIIIAEHYGSPRDYLGSMQWDTVMNYDAFMEPLSFFLTGMEKHSDYFKPELLGNSSAFVSAMLATAAAFPQGSMFTAMNELSNHDHSRFLTRTNKKHGRVTDLGYEAAKQDIDMGIFILGVVMQMTLIGAPTIYYADEAGQVGFTDPDNRRTYPWGREDKGLIELHRSLINIRRDNRALVLGSIIYLNQEDGLLAYARFLDKNKLIIAINMSDYDRSIDVPIWQIAADNTNSYKMIFESNINDKYFSLDTRKLSAEKTTLGLDIKSKSAVIVKIE